jgi:hypothetical protein
MRYLIPILGVLLILVVSCSPPVTPGVPAVTKTVLGNGDTLELTWTAVTSASGYYVYLDGNKNTTTALTYLVIDPAKSIEVSAYNGSEESDKWTLSTAVTVTPTVTVYADSGSSSTDNAFGFITTSGTCLALDITNSANDALIDFVVENAGLSDIEFWSPDQYSPVYNSKDNSTAPSTASSFDNLTKAAEIGQQLYDTKFAGVSINGIYSVWIDPDPAVFGAGDHFGKVDVSAISGEQLTIEAGYQLIGALRWLISQ